MVHNKSLKQVFCSQNMQLQFASELKIKYEKQDSLKSTIISNGVIHPFTYSNNQIRAGITDRDYKFIEESLTNRTSHNDLSVKSNRWFSPPEVLKANTSVKYIDEDVIFLGALSGHYGHFILEGLARLWPLLNNKNRQTKAVFISEVKNNKFIELFRLFGLKEEHLLEIKEVTQFKSIAIPEPSIRLHDYYHSKYKDTIDEIKSKIIPASSRKVFFSKSYSKSGRAIGESFIQRIFSKNGYQIFYPEKMSLTEMLSVMKGCSEFVASSGSNFHNSIFLNDGVLGVCLNRSAHFHPIQTMIDRMRGLNVTYVDVFISSNELSFGNAPCFVGSTKHLIKYFDTRAMSYSLQSLFLEKVVRFFEYQYFVSYRYLYIYFHKFLTKCRAAFG